VRAGHGITEGRTGRRQKRCPGTAAKCPPQSLFGIPYFYPDLTTAEGADVDQRNAKTDKWPLLEAVKLQDVAIVQLLIDHGARSQSHKSNLRSELHALAQLQKGPFPSAQPTTAAHRFTKVVARWWPALPVHIKLWDLLLTAGADVNAYVLHCLLSYT
jgi:hypothetical protein